jgi:hypothetical protein
VTSSFRSPADRVAADVAARSGEQVDGLDGDATTRPTTTALVVSSAAILPSPLLPQPASASTANEMSVVTD